MQRLTVLGSRREVGGGDVMRCLCVHERSSLVTKRQELDTRQDTGNAVAGNRGKLSLAMGVLNRAVVFP